MARQRQAQGGWDRTADARQRREVVLTEAQVAQIRANVEAAPPLPLEAIAAIARADQNLKERCEAAQCLEDDGDADAPAVAAGSNGLSPAIPRSVSRR